MTEKPAAQFVSKCYTMDPTLEDLLFDGSKLVDGMEVLIETDSLRVNPHPTLFGRAVDMLDETRTKALMFNRWALVSDVASRNVRDSQGHRNQMVEFIGTFHDGTKRKFSVGKSHAWYVKKASLPNDGQKAFDDMVADLRKTFGPMLDEGAPFIAGPMRRATGKEAHTILTEMGLQHDCSQYGCNEGETPAEQTTCTGENCDPAGTESDGVTHIPGTITLGMDYSGPAPEATISGGEGVKGLDISTGEIVNTPLPDGSDKPVISETTVIPEAGIKLTYEKYEN